MSDRPLMLDALWQRAANVHCLAQPVDLGPYQAEGVDGARAEQVGLAKRVHDLQGRQEKVLRLHEELASFSQHKLFHRQRLAEDLLLERR